MKINFKDRSTIVLIVVNVLPLLGVLFFGWDSVMIVIFYCIETFIIGIFNMFKMAKSEGEIPEEHMKSKFAYTEVNKQLSSRPGCVKGLLIPFFFVHYNVFVIVQIFVIILITTQLSDKSYEISNFLNIEFLINILLLTISHAYSYKKNYIDKQIYKKASVTKLMIAPYQRVIIQQIAAIFGTFFLILFQAPIGFLILLIIIKIIIDVRAQNKSLKSFEEQVGQYIKEKKEQLL